jgi:hypothetical protein
MGDGSVDTGLALACLMSRKRTGRWLPQQPGPDGEDDEMTAVDGPLRDLWAREREADALLV